MNKKDDKNTNTSKETDKAMEDLASNLLRIDFEKSFVVHQDYKAEQTKLLKFSIKLLSFPMLVIASLVAAKFFNGPINLSGILEIEIIWYCLIISGCLNIIVLRSYIVTDMVQTEAKHQVNSIRNLYLTLLQSKLGSRWRPHWGEFNASIHSKFKIKSASLASVFLALINSIYISIGVYLILMNNFNAGLYKAVIFCSVLAICIYLIQQQWVITKIAGLVEKRKQ